MFIFKLIITTFLATSVMSGFSYLMAALTGKQFKEPQLLNALVRNSKHLPLWPQQQSVLGWVLHYSIGVLFILLLFLPWLFGFWPAGWVAGGVMGLFLGGLGILGWHGMFLLHSNPPGVHLRHFYLQLIVAHVLFALTGTACWRFFHQF